MKTFTSFIGFDNNLFSVSFDNAYIPLPINEIHTLVLIGGCFYYMYQHLKSDDEGLDFK
jgi:hypothetical protein